VVVRSSPRQQYRRHPPGGDFPGTGTRVTRTHHQEDIMRRHISYSHKDRILFLAEVSRHAAEREGLKAREAKEVARYSLSLYGSGRSAGWSLSRASKYARVLAGKTALAGTEAVGMEA
jgi:hypothetical protein